MKKNFTLFAAPLVGLACVVTCQAQTVSWTGAGGNSSWSVAANWSGGVVPGAADDVLITSGLGSNVLVVGNVTVKSLQCSKGLTVQGGSLTLTSGASLISGALAVNGGARLTVNGTLASLSATGAATVNDADLYALNGGVLHLLTLSSATNLNENVSWNADGPGSLLDLANLGTLVQGFYKRLYVQAYDGGKVDLHRLSSAPSAVSIDAQDAGSIVDLSGLAGRWSSQSSGELDLSVQTGASLLVPNVTQLEHASLTIQGTTSGVPTAQMNLFTNVTLMVDDSMPNFAMLTNMDDTSVYVQNGGIAQLTNVTRVSVGNINPTWRADGVQSVLDLSRLNGLTQGFYKRLYVQAYNGGTLDLHRLASAPSAVTVDAQDAGSIVDLSGLAGRWSSQSSGDLDLSVQTGASLLIPNVTQLEHASLTIQGTTSGVPTAQMNLFTNVSLTVDGAMPNFGMLTNMDDTSVYVQDGGIAQLTNVTQVLAGNINPTWRADGAQSLLDLSRLNGLTQGFYKRLYVQAYNGGTLDLHRLASAPAAVTVDAQDAGSIVDLSGLAGRWSSQSSGDLDLSVQTGASLLIPNVTQLEHASLSIQGTIGGVPTAQMSLFTNVSLTVDGAMPSFGMLTNMDDTSVYVKNGGMAHLTSVTRVAVGNINPTWRADGAGSLLDLSRLRALTEGFYKRVYVQAYNGGTVDLHGLASAPSAVTVDAQDAASIVDLSGLAGRWSSQTSGDLDLSVQTGASLLIPNVTQLEHASLSIQGTIGGVPTAQMSLFTNVSLTVDGATPNFGMLTNIDDSSVYALNGGIAHLTNVMQVRVGNVNPTWRADGSGSLVDLSRLSVLTEGFYKRLYVQAYNGGTVDLHGLTSAACAVTVDAQDAGSIVDLSGLAGRWNSQASGDLDLSVQTGASLLIPNVTQLEHASLSIQGTLGGITTAQIDLFTNVNLTVDGAAPNFGTLTNMDDTSIYAKNGGVAELTNVTCVVAGNLNPTWQADGVGSLVNLSRVSKLLQEHYKRVYVQAYHGGKVDLTGLGWASGAVQILADGANSIVNLSGLSSLTGFGSGASSLAAKNGGALLSNNQGLLLANTAVDVPPGDPILPDTLAATDPFTLCAKPWHAYWVEQRDTTQPGSPWEFVMRVPLTNSTQLVSLRPTSNTELRVWEFVAESPILDVAVSPDLQVQLCLYGPTNQTYQLQTTANLLPGFTWELCGNAVMTNGFYILSQGPAVDPARFYRWKY